MVLRKQIGLGVMGAVVSLSLAFLGGSERTATIAQTAPTPTPTENPIPSKPDVPYVPTPETVVTEMLKLAGVSREDVVYDLG